MKFTLISASNIEPARQNSASTHTCELVQDILVNECGPDASVSIVPLIDYEMISCRMCGKCFDTTRCVRDEAFNRVFEQLVDADGIVIVTPQYAPLPSKLVILFEKMEEMVFLRSTDDPEYRFPLYQKPVGIIGHGGQTGDAGLSYYMHSLLDPIATVLTSVQMKVVGAGQEWPYGVVFGVKDISKRKDSIFVHIQHDWEAIRKRITPLVKNVAAFAGERAYP
jgi:multimeric flavodoxin WrbA